MGLFRKNKFDAAWLEDQMLQAFDPAGLSHKERKIVRQAIKKASLRAREAFEIGTSDAKSGKPKKDLRALAAKQGLQDLPVMDLVVKAYEVGYDIVRRENKSG